MKVSSKNQQIWARKELMVNKIKKMNHWINKWEFY